MRVRELVGGPYERWIAARVGRRVGDAPMRHRRCPWKLRAHLPNAVAQADHLVEPVPGELA